MANLTVAITVNADDGWWWNGTWRQNDWCYVGFFSSNNDKADSGFRFPAVAIPAGATISSAILTLNVTSVLGAGATGQIKGRAADNPGQFSDANSPRLVSLTTAAVTVGTRIATTGLKTYDVTAIVAEILARGGWASGNALAISFLSTEAGADNAVKFEDVQAAGGNAASLAITYTASGSRAARHTLLGVG